MEIVIRPFRPEDMDACYFLDRRCYPPEMQIEYGRMYRTMLDGRVTALVAAEDMEEQAAPIVGCLLLRGDEALGELTLLALTVDPDFRRLGLARRLLDWAVRLGEGSGFRVLCAAEETPTAELRGFLEAVGFRSTGERMEGFRCGAQRPRWERFLGGGDTGEAGELSEGNGS